MAVVRVARFCSSSRRTCSPLELFGEGSRVARLLAGDHQSALELHRRERSCPRARFCFRGPSASGRQFAFFGRAGRLAGPAIGFGAAAYLTRPEGLLLSLALLATLMTSAIFRATRLDRGGVGRLIACVVSWHAGSCGPFCCAARRTGHQAGDRTRAGAGSAVESAVRSSARSRCQPINRFFRPTGSRRSACSRSCAPR